MSSVKVGLVGTGQFAAQHLNAWRGMADVEALGVHGSNASRLDAFGAKYSIATYENLETLCQEVDILDIVSANHTHCDYALQALPFVKALVVEKPLDIDDAKASQLCKSAAKAGVLGSVISPFRFRPCYQEIKQLLESQALGKVFLSRVTVCWPRHEDYFQKSGGWRQDKALVGGGVLMHQAIHYIDLLHYFFGKPQQVSGWSFDASGQQDLSKVEQCFTGHLLFSGGEKAQVYCTVDPNAPPMGRLEIFGEQGSLQVDGDYLVRKGPINTSLQQHLKYRVPQVFQRKQIRTLTQLLQAQFQDILQALSSDTLPLVFLESGLDALRTVQQLYSAQGGPAS